MSPSRTIGLQSFAARPLPEGFKKAGGARERGCGRGRACQIFCDSWRRCTALHSEVDGQCPSRKASTAFFVSLSSVFACFSSFIVLCHLRRTSFAHLNSVCMKIPPPAHMPIPSPPLRAQSFPRKWLITLEPSRKPLNATALTCDNLIWLSRACRLYHGKLQVKLLPPPARLSTLCTGPLLASCTFFLSFSVRLQPQKPPPRTRPDDVFLAGGRPRPRVRARGGEPPPIHISFSIAGAAVPRGRCCCGRTRSGAARDVANLSAAAARRGPPVRDACRPDTGRHRP